MYVCMYVNSRGFQLTVFLKAENAAHDVITLSTWLCVLSFLTPKQLTDFYETRYKIMPVEVTLTPHLPISHTRDILLL